MRKKIAYSVLNHYERCDRGFINERPIVSMICGTMGKKKTTLLTDIALSQEVMFRDKAFEKILENNLKFPHFPWINLELELKRGMKYHQIFNLYTVNKYVRKKKSRFLKNPSSETLYGYDYERYGTTYNDKLKVVDIWDVIETYSKLYYIYVIESSLIISNYSVRVDNVFSLYSGLASGEKLLVENHPGMMFGKERFQAEYLYNTRAGFLKYNIPNEYVKEGKLSELQISMEISSETFGYNEDFPSDITFSINGTELCTWTCPGSYGDKYGVYTPSWWYPESAKYGLLTTIKIKEKGVFINEEPFNRNIGLSNLNLSEGIYTEFKIEVKPTAKHCGGFCLFGENFGNHNQAIVFTAFYRK